MRTFLPTSPVEAQPRILRLSDLPRALSQCGYADFVANYLVLGCDIGSMASARSLAPLTLRPLLDLFLLGQTISEDDLPDRILPFLPLLEQYGILTRNAQRLKSSGLSLLFIHGRWIFCQQLFPSPSIYFGDDSLALMRRLTPPPGGKVLDLCSGPGTQAIHCAGLAAEVVAVELNPAAGAVAYLNVAMNGLESRVTLRLGSLYDPVKGRQFDLICANPPLLPIPSNLSFPFVGDGGVDGFAVTRRIVGNAPAHLHDRGSVQIIGTCLSDGLLPHAIEHLEESLPSTLDALVTVTAHMPCRRGDWQFEMLAATVRPSEGSDPRRVLEEALVSARASHLCYFFARLTEGTGAVVVMDLSQEHSRRHLWYA